MSSISNPYPARDSLTLGYRQISLIYQDKDKDFLRWIIANAETLVGYVSDSLHQLVDYLTNRLLRTSCDRASCQQRKNCCESLSSIRSHSVTMAETRVVVHYSLLVRYSFFGGTVVLVSASLSHPLRLPSFLQSPPCQVFAGAKMPLDTKPPPVRFGSYGGDGAVWRLFPCVNWFKRFLFL